MMNLNNVNTNAANRIANGEEFYVVVRKSENEWWYWGSFNNENEAWAAAIDIGGEVEFSTNIRVLYTNDWA